METSASSSSSVQVLARSGSGRAARFGDAVLFCPVASSAADDLAAALEVGVRSGSVVAAIGRAVLSAGDDAPDFVCVEFDASGLTILVRGSLEGTVLDPSGAEVAVDFDAAGVHTWRELHLDAEVGTSITIGAADTAAEPLVQGSLSGGAISLTVVPATGDVAEARAEPSTGAASAEPELSGVDEDNAESGSATEGGEPLDIPEPNPEGTSLLAHSDPIDLGLSDADPADRVAAAAAIAAAGVDEAGDPVARIDADAFDYDDAAPVVESVSEADVEAVDQPPPPPPPPPESVSPPATPSVAESAPPPPTPPPTPAPTPTPTPTPTPIVPPADPGHTVPHPDHEFAPSANEPLPEGTVLVEAKSCGLGHANAPMATECRTCGAFLPPETSVLELLARPSLGVLELDDGTEYDLDTEMLLGRNAGADDNPDRVALRAIDTPGEEVSRTHLEVRLRGWDVEIIDCGSTNGTVVQLGDGPSVDVTAGVPMRIEPGTTVYFGSRSFTYR